LEAGIMMTASGFAARRVVLAVLALASFQHVAPAAAQESPPPKGIASTELEVGRRW
jgi:hypothetical protein